MASVFFPAPAYAGTKEGDKLLKQGREAEARRNYDVALDFYEKALALDPKDTSYLLSVRRVRFAAAQGHVDQGQRLRADGKLDEALAEFKKALTMDPGSIIAEQEIKRTNQMMDREKTKKGGAPPTPETRGLTPGELARREAERRASSILPVPELKPVSRNITGLKMVNQTARVLYETLGKLAGINVLFDAEFQDQKRYTLDVNGSTLDEALDYISLLTKTFWKPLSANAIFVTQDNVTKRRDYEEQVTRVFYLQNLTSPQELQEVMTGMRTVTDVRKVFPINSQSAIVVRGTVDQVALAEKVLLDLDRSKPEVIVDVIVMEANRSRVRDLALTPISGGNAGITASIVFNPQNRPAVPVGGGSGTSTGTLVPLGSIGNLTAGDWSVTLPGYLVQAMMTDSSTKILTTPQVRATDGQKASLRLGDRYPYATGSFQPGVGAVGVSPLVSTQFQFAEVGINVDITPRIHAGEEVSMQVEFEISNIRETVNIGGLSQPVIGQRKVNHIIRVKEGEVTLIGGLMQATVTKNRNGVPGLMNLPVIGKLFSQEHLENINNDLLVALVPHIVRAPEFGPDNMRTIATGTETIYKLNYAPPKEAAPAAQPAKPTGPAGLPAVPPQAVKPTPGAPTVPAQPSPAPESTPPPVNPDLAKSPDTPGLARPSSASTGLAMSFRPSATEIPQNGTVTVNLQIDNVNDLFSAPMRIKYDNKVLKLVEVQRGAFLGNDGQQVTFSESKAEESGFAIVNMNRVPGAGGISGSGTLLTLKFQAIGKGASPITFEELTLRDARLESIAVTAPSTTVTVK